MQLIDTRYEGEGIDLKVELAELPSPKKSKTKTKTNNKDNKRRRTSSVWHFFQMLPTKDGEKPTCKCKKCGKEYSAIGVYGCNTWRKEKTKKQKQKTRERERLKKVGYLSKSCCGVNFIINITNEVFRK